MTKKVELEGELFVLVEMTEDNEDVNISVDLAGINIWDWIKQHNGENVKITLEIKDKETE